MAGNDKLGLLVVRQFNEIWMDIRNKLHLMLNSQFQHVSFYNFTYQILNCISIHMCNVNVYRILYVQYGNMTMDTCLCLYDVGYVFQYNLV